MAEHATWMKPSAALEDLVSWCDQATGSRGFPDYAGASNGLQFENSGRVHRIAAVVDSNLPTVRAAAAAGCDFLIAHHGMLWGKPKPIVGPLRERFGILIQSDIALYSCHLPLDAHPQLGNNVLIARELDMQIRSRFLSFEGRPIGCVCDGPGRAHLRARLDRLFPNGYRCIEFGDEGPGLVAISSGGGNGAFEPFLESGARTLITGELSQHLFSEAAENRRNVYVCGHYATETFGVRALAAAAADAFGLPWQFIDTACPL